MSQTAHHSENGAHAGSTPDGAAPDDPGEAEPAPPQGSAGDGPDSDDPAPEQVHGVPDATLGGYFGHHDRPPGFEGADRQPYTVSLEVEKTADLAAPYHGYLVFPRWAETGLGIVDHLETPTLVEARTRQEAISGLEELPLEAVKKLLDEAIDRRNARQEGEEEP